MPTVIDLVSSSPPPRPAPRSAARDPPPSSDDFDLFLAGRPPAKRPRTSRDPNPPPSKPPLRLNHNASLSRRALDPIEVSSSMEQLPHARQSPVKSPLRAASRPALPTIDSDPFASSPVPPRLPPPSRAAPFRRAVSLDPFGSSPVATRLAPRSAQRPGVDSDPPEPAAPSNHHDVISIGDSSSVHGSDSDLPDIKDLQFRRRSGKPLARSQSDITSSVRPRPASRAAESKTRKRPAQSAEDKAADKERKRLEREHAKEARAREKERAAAVAEANKLRTDKKVSTPEMIVDLPATLSPDHKTQVETMLAELGVEHSTCHSPHDCIRWRRKVTSRFDDALGRWEPIPPRIHDETHVLVIMTADRFIHLMQSQDLDAHARRVLDAFPGHRVILLLQGMTPWMRKNRNVRNRQFASGVRAEQAPARSRARAAEYVPEEDVEDALLRLQVKHDTFIHHTVTPVETARWVVTFTQHISTIPYRKQRDHATSAAGFCMESGQVKTGDGSKDTYVKMLQEIVRITAPIAYGVAMGLTPSASWSAA
ncbi:hypothetical protein HIM_08674 [Hirsutella minnesotensis 3608]|uniref:ERCC4 domain-containing protein n=1 Tax=Hirsutella minnesotensis 3608 TaxID=1043627 RepID=A0A0F7ZST4_9HYPO|nr:hypothetical protein HIM_08674 [Hirsutella minnesotensis 3608]